MNERTGELALIAPPVLGLIGIAVRRGGGFTGWESLRTAAAVVVIAAVVVLVLLIAAASPARAQLRGHAHVHGRLQGKARRRFIARHEAGHVAVARACGATGVRAEIGSDNNSGGMWSRTLPGGVVAAVAVARGGRKAVGSSYGCSGDRAIERAALRDVPYRDRGAVVRQADRLATRAVNSARGQIRRDAAHLDRTGRL